MVTFICNHCKQEKSVEFYGKDKYRPYGLKTKCKQCEAELRQLKAPEHRRRAKEIYENNRDRIKGYQRKWSQSEKGRKKNKESRVKCSLAFYERIHAYYNGECFICHLNEPYYEVYDCHHLDPASKNYIISYLVGFKWDIAVVPELEKCVYLCAICHRKLHAGWFDKEIERGELILIPGKR